MAPLQGVHRVRKTLSNGWRAEYWYAWRGGPSILSCKAPSAPALKREIAKAAPAAAARLVQLQKPDRAEGLIAGLIYAYQGSPEFAKLAERTKADARKHLSVIHQDLGEMQTRALEARGARGVLLAWRDRYADRPRTADHYMAALDQMLKWGRDRDLVHADPLSKWPRLYRVDRAAIVWEPQDLAAILKHAGPELSRAIRVAAYSGLRLGDLLALTWFQVGEFATHTITRKRHRGAMIPMTPLLKAALDECPRQGDETKVLTDPDGKPWKASTLAKHFRIARAAAKITGKRWHDLRGTFVTHAARCGFGAEEIAAMVGWKREAVDQVIRRYVTADAIAKAAIERFTAREASR